MKPAPSVEVARNDLALRIALDVMGIDPLTEMERANELAKWMAEAGTDIGEATARLVAAARTEALTAALQAAGDSWPAIVDTPTTAVEARRMIMGSIRDLLDKP